MTYYTIKLGSGVDVTPDNFFRRSAKGRRDDAQALANQHNDRVVLRKEHHQVSKRNVWFFDPKE